MIERQHCEQKQQALHAYPSVLLRAFYHAQDPCGMSRAELNLGKENLIWVILGSRNRTRLCSGRA